ncbi:MAG: hypothetical protein CMI19_03860 [Opitutae bacterium]|nr:hypothetical protein [Opitutae bacterium]|tara:strand:+ start:1347 stop:2120 length:774 start_codon:yes stop_codon:yes gene_type:complete
MEFTKTILPLSKINEIGDAKLSGNDLEFFKRVWATNFDVYSERLEAICFNGKKRILDAGCGFGQWSVALALKNGNIDALDCSKERVDALEAIASLLGLGNIKTHYGTIENLPFNEETYDAIYCYSSIYFTDVKKTIEEFARVLKPNARLYLSTNGVGWYLHNLIEGHNDSNHFDSRAMAINAIVESLNYYSSDYQNISQLITPSKFLRKLLLEYGFEIIDLRPDGKIVLNSESKPKSFYPESYYGLEGVYEIVAEKK